MSKNITIQEGGVAKQLTVGKLKTNLASSGTCLWVPEDEVQLTTKTITENGTYKASDDGYYGYEQVVVSGVGTVSGTDPTTGEDVVVTTDPETGEIVETTVPHSIGVTTPPTNPYGIYTNGQTITKDGMVVKAYLKSGDLYDTTDYPNGIVPNNEVTLSPTTAAYDASTDTGSGEATLDGDTLDYARSAYWTYQRPLYTQHVNVWSSAYLIALHGDIIAISQSNDIDAGGTYTSTYETYETSGEVGFSRPSTGTYTYEGVTKTFYTRYSTVTYFNDTMQEWSGSLTNYPDLAVTDAARILFEGDREENPRGSVQTINVSWPRPLDGKVLETTFEILVAPPYSNGEES